MDELLELAELCVMSPFQVWSAFEEGNSGTKWESLPPIGPADGDVAAAVLRQFGFVVDAPPKQLDSMHALVRFRRGPDVVTVAIMQSSVFVIFHTETADDSILDDPDRAGTFGAFPIRPRIEASAGVAMKRVIEWFVQATGETLAERPLQVARLRQQCHDFVEAQRLLVLEPFHRTLCNEAWAAGRHRSAIEHYEHLDELVGLNDEERRRLEFSRREVAQQVEDRPSAGESLVAIVDEVVRANARVHETFSRREATGGIACWEDAAYEASDAVTRFETYVEQIENGLRERSRGSIDAAIEFLEADPWCFRSGYAKGRLLRRLRRCEFSWSQRLRLATVVLHVVDAGGRLEFRDATRLARRLGGAELRGGLRRRLHGADTGVARRALLALVDLRHPSLTEVDLSAARRLVLDELRRHSGEVGEYGPDWPERLARRFSRADWTTALLNEIRTGGPDQRGAFIVLAQQSILPASDEDLGLLRNLLIEMVRHGGDERGLESMAALVDHPLLRLELERCLQEPDEEVRRRAWWALGAIRRFEETE